MQRAAHIFAFDERPAESPLVDRIWRTQSEPVDSFLSVAENHWEMVVVRSEGEHYLTVRGPETKATATPIPQDAEFFGVQFRCGAFMPSFPLRQLVDGTQQLPEAARDRMWLDGSVWELPNYDNADVFVNRLVRKGLLIRDPLVEAVLRGNRPDLSPRSVQRRIVRATGLTHGMIRQIARAKQATALLDAGATILDAVERTGYADQAHLSRSLKRFMGLSPRQLRGERTDRSD